MEDETELVVANIHGYRSWAVRRTPEGPELVSLFAGKSEPWLRGKPKAATCDAAYRQTQKTGVYSSFFSQFLNPPVADHDAPGPECACGIWGYHEPDQEENYLLSSMGRFDAKAEVAGVVRASGTVEMHETGFRAERVDILAVSPLREDPTPGSMVVQSVMGWVAYPGCGCSACRPAPLSTGNLDTIRAIGERYGVPAFDTFADMVEAFPPTQQNEPANRGEADGLGTNRSWTYTPTAAAPGATWSQMVQAGYMNVPVAYPNPWLSGAVTPTPSARQPNYQQQIQWNGTAPLDPNATVPAVNINSTASLSSAEWQKIVEDIAAKWNITPTDDAA